MKYTETLIITTQKQSSSMWHY